MRPLATLALGAILLLHQPPVARAAATVLMASADGSGGYYEGVFHDAPSLAEVLTQLPARPSGDITVQLLTDSPDAGRITEFRRPCGFQFTYSGSSAARLTIRGVRQGDRWLTQISGFDLDATIRQTGCRQRSASDSGTAERPGEAASLSPASLAVVAPAMPGTQRNRINCFALHDSAFVAFEDLAFKDCWLPAIYAVDSHHIALRRSFIQGSSYVLYAVASHHDPDRAHDFAIEENLWIQDTSGFGLAPGGPCAGPPRDVDCPGEMWTAVPWGVTHDGEWQPYNGALFGSINIAGAVDFRGNTVRNAYNGLRMIVDKPCRESPSCKNRVNRHVRIHDNLFAYVRDNPIEPEGRAVDWRIYHNRFFNNHAWISTDGVGGGPVYVWGNLGWFDAIPGEKCVDGPRWRDSRVFNFAADSYVLARDVFIDFDSQCDTHRGGTVIKLGAVGRALDLFYVFNNSWMLRMPVAAGGNAHGIFHWNNAIDFLGCGPGGVALCRTRAAPPSPRCPACLSYPTPDGSTLFFDRFDFLAGEGRTPYVFDFDVSSRGFPDAMIAFGLESHGRQLDAPLFAGAEHGDFRPADGLATLLGCTVEPLAKGRGLRCVVAPDKPRPLVGAIQRDGSLYAGPFAEKAP